MPIPYFPFSGETYKPSMGIKPLQLENWIEVDENLKKDLELKSSLVENHYETVIQQFPSADGAILELERLLVKHLLRYFPDLYEISGDLFTVKATGRSFQLDGDAKASLIRLAHYVQEDFCLMSARAPVHLEAGSVCFPSRWKIGDKIGKDSVGIHIPVPMFAQTIGKPTASFLEMIPKERPVWRTNWTLHDSDELFCPEARESKKNLSVENVLDETHIRVERQTLRRLPETSYVAFTIRTYTYSVREAISDPKRKDILIRTLDGLPEDVAFYKGMRKFFDTLKTALKTQN